MRTAAACTRRARAARAAHGSPGSPPLAHTACIQDPLVARVALRKHTTHATSGSWMHAVCSKGGLPCGRGRPSAQACLLQSSTLLKHGQPPRAGLCSQPLHAREHNHAHLPAAPNSQQSTLRPWGPQAPGLTAANRTHTCRPTHHSTHLPAAPDSQQSTLRPWDPLAPGPAAACSTRALSGGSRRGSEPAAAAAPPGVGVGGGTVSAGCARCRASTRKQPGAGERARGAPLAQWATRLAARCTCAGTAYPLCHYQ